MSTTPPPKPKCPDCGVELEGTPEKCAKCGFEIQDYSSFYKFFKTAAKQLSAEEEAEAAKNKPPAAKKRSTLDYIRGKKKA